MKIITRYLFKNIVTYVALVVLFLFGLHFFLELIYESPKLGTGSYGLASMFTYIALMLPYNVYQFFPMASLIGMIIAFGLLAANSELVVMRTSGISILRIFFIAVKASILFVIAVLFLGEFLSPITLPAAARLKAVAISGGQAFLTAKEQIWLHDGNSFIYINSLSSDGKLLGIANYAFDKDVKNLKSLTISKVGTYNDGAWNLQNGVKTLFDKESIKQIKFSSLPAKLKFGSNLVGMAHSNSNYKNIFELHSYIVSRQNAGLDANNYLFDFWQRVLAPFAVLVMVLLAIPFVFGSTRNTTMGFRMMIGMLLSFSFYLLHQLGGSVNAVLGLSPFLASALPIIIFAFLGMILLCRTR